MGVHSSDYRLLDGPRYRRSGDNGGSPISRRTSLPAISPTQRQVCTVVCHEAIDLHARQDQQRAVYPGRVSVNGTRRSPTSSGELSEQEGKLIEQEAVEAADLAPEEGQLSTGGEIIKEPPEYQEDAGQRADLFISSPGGESYLREQIIVPAYPLRHESGGRTIPLSSGEDQGGPELSGSTRKTLSGKWGPEKKGRPQGRIRSYLDIRAGEAIQDGVHRASGIPIPTEDDASTNRAHEQFIDWMQETGGRLVSSGCSTEELAHFIDQAVAKSPSDHLKDIRAEMEIIREMALSSVSENETLLSSVSPSVQQVLRSAGVNRPANVVLLSKLVKRYRIKDGEAVIQDLLHGFPLVGTIPAGTGKPEDMRSVQHNLSFLREQEPDLSQKILKTRRNLSHLEQDEEILQQTLSEIRAGRMTPLKPIDPQQDIAPTRRFGVYQNGKIRTIDDYRRSLVNGMCSVDTRIQMGHVNDVICMTSALSQAGYTGELHIIKSDFKAAYRACPILPEHLHLSRVALWDPGVKEYRESTQLAMPFGAVSAVYAWHRLGGLITSILQSALKYPISRFVDDLFTVCPCEISHSIRQFILEIVNSYLGFTLEISKTPEPCSTQTILGIRVNITRRMRRDKISHTVYLGVDEAKAKQWLPELSHAIRSRRLSRDDARKIAGRLDFISQSILGPVGAARSRPIYEHIRTGRTNLSTAAVESVCWWASLIQSNRQTPIPCGLRSSRPILSLTDASGGGGLGIVVITEKQRLWLSAHVSELGVDLSSVFKDRSTQIIPLEGLAVITLIVRFMKDLRNRDVIIAIDNKTILESLRKGRSKVPDINALICSIVQLCDRHNVRLYPVWVPSKLNIADIPSRQRCLSCGTRVWLNQQTCDVIHSVVAKIRRN